ALRPKQAEKADEDVPAPRLVALRAADGRGREVHERILAEQHIFVAAGGAFADARPRRLPALEAAHQGEEVVPPGLALQVPGEAHGTGLRAAPDAVIARSGATKQSSCRRQGARDPWIAS